MKKKNGGEGPRNEGDRGNSDVGRRKLAPGRNGKCEVGERREKDQGTKGIDAKPKRGGGKRPEEGEEASGRPEKGGGGPTGTLPYGALPRSRVTLYLLD